SPPAYSACGTHVRGGSLRRAARNCDGSAGSGTNGFGRVSSSCGQYPRQLCVAGAFGHPGDGAQFATVRRTRQEQTTRYQCAGASGCATRSELAVLLSDVAAWRETRRRGESTLRRLGFCREERCHARRTFEGPNAK